MKRVGIKALKNNLSAVIREVEAGATVLVTDRDRVVARITPEPVATVGVETNDEILARLERDGVLKRSRARVTGPPPRLGSVPIDELMRQLDEDRADRW